MRAPLFFGVAGKRWPRPCPSTLGQAPSGCRSSRGPERREGPFVAADLGPAAPLETFLNTRSAGDPHPEPSAEWRRAQFVILVNGRLAVRQMVVHVPVGHLRRLSDACLLRERA